MKIWRHPSVAYQHLYSDIVLSTQLHVGTFSEHVCRIARYPGAVNFGEIEIIEAKTGRRIGACGLRCFSTAAYY